MAECEICGKETDDIYIVEVEGAQLSVCESCARGKKVIEHISPVQHKQESMRFSRRANDKKGSSEEEIIENYGEAIRKARERLNLPLSVVAERINEKESTLKRVEEQKTLPSVTLTKKLEKELGIKLTATPQDKGGSVQLKRDTPITLWDAAEKKDASKKKGGE